MPDSIASLPNYTKISPPSHPHAAWSAVRSETDGWFWSSYHIALGVAAAHIVLGLFATILGDSSGNETRHLFFNAGLALYGTGGAICLLARWRPSAAVKMGAITLSAVAILGDTFLATAGFLLLMPAPLFLLAMQGLPRSALGIALLQICTLQWVSIDIGWQDTMLVTLVNGSVVLLAHSARERFMGTAGWAMQQYEAARCELDAARNRNVDLGVLLDELVHANRQLDLMNERVASMRARAEEAQRAKAAFVAKVSHEFRTPLNMIIGLMDLLLDHPQLYGQQLPPLLTDDLKIVHRNCEHLADMINDVLDLSQTEAGRLRLQKEWGDLSADIRYAADVVRPLVEKRGLQLYLEGVDRAVRVFRDPTRVRQILLNLLSNAARYTVQGSITIRLKECAPTASIEVVDTGPGIASADRERIFEPFYQAGSLEGRSQTGSGLGLSITKQLVELHGGRLWLESATGQGSTFFIVLPISPPPPPIAQPAGWIHPDWQWLERQARPQVPTAPRESRILVCDDVDGVHPLLEHEMEGVEFVAFQHVNEVEPALAAAPAHAVFVNASSSQEALQAVERIGCLDPHMPVFGWAMPSPMSRALAAGAKDYLVKPVTRADLLAALRSVQQPIRRILVIDDEQEVRQLLTRMLRAIDELIEIDVAADEASGFDCLLQKKPDLLLLDLGLADGDGWALLARKQSCTAVAEIPTVIISSQDPMDSLPVSPVLISSMGAGFSRDTLTRASFALVSLMQESTPGAAPAPLEIRDDESA